VDAGKREAGAWLTEYLDELEVLPLGSHDDQVDATRGAVNLLTSSGGGFVINIS
jgi:phage terminase large subunit-like protein